MASIEKRKTSRGVRYDVRYREPGGRPRVKTWRRRADAERFARQVEVDKDRGLLIDPALARTTVADGTRSSCGRTSCRTSGPGRSAR